MSLEEQLKKMVDKFNDSVEKDENLRDYIKDMDRTIRIDITDGDTYLLKLHDCNMTFADEMEGDDVDIKVTASDSTMAGLIDGSVKPMKAYATKKLKIKASLQDLMLMRKLL